MARERTDLDLLGLDHAVIEEAIQKTRTSIERGETVSAPLRETNVFPSMVVQMINVGETTGALDAGAPVPRGADTIVIQENTDTAPGVVIVKEAAPQRHIRPRGQDFAAGDVLLRAGLRLGPRELMLAAAMNHAELPVRRKPKVAILATGDEVVPPGTELMRDQVVSSVPAGLAALIETHGGEPMSLGIAKDSAESLARASTVTLIGPLPERRWSTAR